MLSQGHMVHPYTITPAKLAPDLGIQHSGQNGAILSEILIKIASELKMF
jgi:hypothetical protein